MFQRWKMVQMALLLHEADRLILRDLPLPFPPALSPTPA